MSFNIFRLFVIMILEPLWNSFSMILLIESMMITSHFWFFFLLNLWHFRSLLSARSTKHNRNDIITFGNENEWNNDVSFIVKILFAISVPFPTSSSLMLEKKNYDINRLLIKLTASLPQKKLNITNRNICIYSMLIIIISVFIIRGRYLALSPLMFAEYYVYRQTNSKKALSVVCHHIDKYYV